MTLPIAKRAIPKAKRVDPDFVPEMERLHQAYKDMMESIAGHFGKIPKSGPQPIFDRFPYVDERLNFEVQDAEQEALVNEVLGWRYEELVELHEELKRAQNLNYPEIYTHQHSLKIRAWYYRISVLKAGGKFAPTPSFWDNFGAIVEGWMVGSIISDEYSKRFHNR